MSEEQEELRTEVEHDLREEVDMTLNRVRQVSIPVYPVTISHSLPTQYKFIVQCSYCICTDVYRCVQYVYMCTCTYTLVQVLCSTIQFLSFLYPVCVYTLYMCVCVYVYV